MKKNRRILLSFILSLTLILMAGCDPSKKWQKQEEALIDNYISSLGDTVAVLKPSGLYYIEIQAGTGRIPVSKDTVSIRYKGMFLDGTVFSSNLQDTVDFSFIVGAFQVIDGIDEGVRYMKEGGIAKLLTPSELAYGATGYGYISGYTPLLWQINLVKGKTWHKKVNLAFCAI